MKPQGFLLDGTAVGGASGRGLHHFRTTCLAKILQEDSMTRGFNGSEQQFVYVIKNVNNTNS